jgi:hypothetical protein
MFTVKPVVALSEPSETEKVKVSVALALSALIAEAVGV